MYVSVSELNNTYSYRLATL